MLDNRHGKLGAIQFIVFIIPSFAISAFAKGTQQLMVPVCINSEKETCRGIAKSIQLKINESKFVKLMGKELDLNFSLST